MNDRLSPEGLRYAQAVARTGSFSAAAREYDVTQPALSNAIRRLEKILGARLFERNTRGARPTVFGATILPRIDAALAALDAITAVPGLEHVTGVSRLRSQTEPRGHRTTLLAQAAALPTVLTTVGAARPLQVTVHPPSLEQLFLDQYTEQETDDGGEPR